MDMHQQKRLVGLLASVVSAVVLIYGAFHYPQLAAAGAWNVPLWLGVIGIGVGAALMVHGSHSADKGMAAQPLQPAPDTPAAVPTVLLSGLAQTVDDA